MSTPSRHDELPRQKLPTLEEQLRELKPPLGDDVAYYSQEGVFDSDEELDAFQAYVRESRRAGTS